MRLSWMLLFAAGTAAGCATAWMLKRRSGAPRRRRSISGSGRVRLGNGHGISGRFHRKGRRGSRFAVSAS